MLDIYIIIITSEKSNTKTEILFTFQINCPLVLTSQSAESDTVKAILGRPSY